MARLVPRHSVFIRRMMMAAVIAMVDITTVRHYFPFFQMLSERAFSSFAHPHLAVRQAHAILSYTRTE